jgi:phytoene dehydrogenase-like protein
MNRRELLESFLGIPLAMISGCGVNGPQLPPAGEIVGASAGLGHRLRDGFKPEVKDANWKTVDVVIVGGGVAGLSAARRLKQQGIDDFVLLELEDKLGGTSVSGSSKLVEYPWGAHYLPAPLSHNKPLVELLDEMEIFEGRDENGEPIVAEQMLCRAPQERVYFEGDWFEGLYVREGASQQDLDEFAAFRAKINQWVDWRDEQGRRAFTIPVSECSDADEVMSLDKMTMADWLRSNGWESKRLHWYADYACKDDYGMTVEQTSAWAGVFYFAARVAQSGKPSQPFIVWPEGNGRLIKHLQSSVEKETKSGWAVSQVTSTESGVDVVAINKDEAKAAKGWHAKRIIFAAPPFLAPYLIHDYASEGPQSIQSFQFGSWLVANLHLKDRLNVPEDAYPLSWDNVMIGSPALGYVVATHQVGLDYGPTVLTYYYPLTDSDPKVARERLLKLSWAEWADVVLADLERAHTDIRDLTTRLDLMRWGHAMVRPVPGFVSSSARQDCSKPFRNIHFAHSSLSGVALFEEAFDHGNRAAAEVVAALK